MTAVSNCLVNAGPHWPTEPKNEITKHEREVIYHARVGLHLSDRHPRADDVVCYGIEITPVGPAVVDQVMVAYDLELDDLRRRVMVAATFSRWLADEWAHREMAIGQFLENR